MLVFGLLTGVALAASPPQGVSIRLTGYTFTLMGWKAPATAPRGGWPSLFAVYAGTGRIPPLLGDYSVQGGRLSFRPRFPFSPGMHYRAVFRPPGGGALVQRTFAGPAPATVPTTRIVQVYPTADVLPSNDLRLYIYFSAPMSRGEAARYIHLLGPDGKVLKHEFLPGDELWDPRYDMLAIMFDPGRIKRGLTSNEELGPPIVDGRHYTLVIDRGWPDARGVPLVAGLRKSFQGGPAERIAPDPRQWRVTDPRAHSRDALAVRFPTPMNYPLLRRMLWVTRGGSDVPGRIRIDRHETEWRFSPQQPWKPGAYRLMIDTRLEDLAGNRIGLLFDIDTFRRVTRRITTRTVSLPFVVR